MEKTKPPQVLARRSEHGMVHVLGRCKSSSTNRQLGTEQGGSGTAFPFKATSFIDMCSPRRSPLWCATNMHVLLLLIRALVLPSSAEIQSVERYQLCQWYTIVLFDCVYRD
jgi:hypothetical protein